MAWIYGITGSTNLDDDPPRFSLDPPSQRRLVLVTLATALMFVGFAFKVSAAPFQMWAPDVYQGAPAPVTASCPSGPKAAAFAMFAARLPAPPSTRCKDAGSRIVWVSALATMIIGNFAALRQTNIKRMLAYSSIAHAGYMMVAVTAHSEIGAAAVMFYLAAYAFMNLGAFAVVTHRRRARASATSRSRTSPASASANR